ncbi:MAG: glycosyltransferase family 4 protein [Acidobacteriota bacterium]
MTLRIGIDGRYIGDHYPGIGRYLFNLARALPEASPDVEYFLLHNPRLRNTRHPIEELQQEQLRLVETAVPIRSLREQFALPRIARQLRLHLFHAPYLVTALHWPCPEVINLYDLIPERHPQTLTNALARRYYRFVLETKRRRAAAILTLSEASKQELLRGHASCRGLARRLFVTPAAADPRFQPASAKAIAAAREELRLPHRYVLYLGTHRNHKNLVRLVDAWRMVSRAGANGHVLVLAGREDPRFPEARRRVHQLGLQNVSFPGEVAETRLAALYSAASLFVLPSLSEGFGMPLLEAMACGVPVACSATSCLPEVAGDAAVQFDPTDTRSMAAAIAPLLNDERRRRRLARRSLERAARFSWKRTAQLTFTAYGKALKMTQWAANRKELTVNEDSHDDQQRVATTTNPP